MATAKIKLPRLHKTQETIRQERKRHNVLCNGRRWGKNIFLQFLASETAITGGAVGWGAPVYRQILDDYRALQNVLQPVSERSSISEMRIDVAGGGVVEFWSMDKPDTIRGKKYNRFIVNEAAFVHNLVDIRNFIIMPTLIDYRGDEYYSGTPKGRNGFFQLYNMQGSDWMRWQISSYDNPFIPRDELDALKHTMTERSFQQEIMAQFLEDGGGVFRYVLDAIDAEYQDDGKGQYIIGVDWGRVEDATVFCVLDAARRQQVHMERITGMDYNLQRLRLRELWERYGKPPVVAEYNSMGGPQVEALQRDGVNITPFTTTNASKARIIQSLEMAFEKRDIKIIDDETQTNELMAYQSERLTGGLLRYNAPEGAHDDCVIALALAWQACAQDDWFML